MKNWSFDLNFVSSWQIKKLHISENSYLILNHRSTWYKYITMNANKTVLIWINYISALQLSALMDWFCGNFFWGKRKSSFRKDVVFSLFIQPLWQLDKINKAFPYFSVCAIFVFNTVTCIFDQIVLLMT